MRLESGADDLLPFHADVKKLVECELHSPTHSVHKENLCWLNAIQIVYFDTKEQNGSAMQQLLQRTAIKKVTCSSVKLPVGTDQIIFFVAKHSLPGFCVPGTCGSSCKSVAGGVRVKVHSFLTFPLSLTAPQCNRKLETVYHTSHSLCKIE